ncbi:MAG: hypothetical protein E7351_00865 [Clostridiales bacterium]|nr:hypothetical protein [Clostridiales bacterium]
MGKKSKILYYSILLVNVVFFILDLLPINFPFFRISFAVSLILIGIMLIVRAVNLKIDSSLFFGVVLFICGILNLVLYFGQLYLNITSSIIWPYYILAVAVANIITAIYFKDRLQYKLCILFTGYGLISILFVQKVLILGWFIGLMIAWFVLYFVVNIIITKKRGK